MSIACTKSLSIHVTLPLIRCNCGDTLNPVRPRIVGYHDGLISPVCAGAIPGAGPLWDGTFTVPGVAGCGWGADTAAFTAININRNFAGADLATFAPANWSLTIYNRTAFPPIILWAGESPAGTGGPCTSPVGLVFTRVFSSCPLASPLTLTIEQFP